jgi:hypothetical protein
MKYGDGFAEVSVARSETKMVVGIVLMQRGEPMIKVPYGQDPYSVIGKYIRDHITAIEDIIAVIKIDDITTNQLFMADMNEENYFIWDNDWYEGEKDVALIDFFPVSEAINPSAQPEPEEDCDTCKHGYFGDRQCDNCRVRYPSHYEREEDE